MTASTALGGALSGVTYAYWGRQHPAWMIAQFSIAALSFPLATYLAWWLSRSENIADAATLSKLRWWYVVTVPPFVAAMWIAFLAVAVVRAVL